MALEKCFSSSWLTFEGQHYLNTAVENQSYQINDFQNCQLIDLLCENVNNQLMTHRVTRQKV